MEIMVALAFLTTCLVAISSVLFFQLSSVSASTNQQVAKQLLDKAMEQARALPYQTVAQGLSTTDLASSPDVGASGNISLSGSTYTFKATGEQIPVTTGLSNEAPLVPHQSTTTLNGTTFTISAYPSIPTAASTHLASVPTGLMRVSVTVSWTKGPLGGVHSVTDQTFVYPTTCLAADNNPWEGPCQAFFTADAGAGDGSGTTITGSVLGQSITLVEFFLPAASSSMQVQQTASVNGCVQSSGGQLSVTGVTPETYPYQMACSNAANGPGVTGTSPASINQQASSWSWPLGVLGLNPAGSDTGTSVSTLSAATSQGCDDLSVPVPVAQGTGLPCGSSFVNESGSTATVAAALGTVSGISLGSVPLLSMTPSSSTASFVAQYGSGSSATYCKDTSGDGCVHAGAARSMTVELGGLPSGLLGVGGLLGIPGTPPVGCPSGNYLMALSGYSDQVSSESGVSPAAPSTTTNGGGSSDVCYWTGSGWQATPISLTSIPQPISTSPLSFNTPLGTVSVSATFSMSLGTSEVSPNSGSCTTSPCSASATVTSPIQGTMQYSVSVLGTQVVNLSVDVDLGSLTASTSYQAAP